MEPDAVLQMHVWLCKHQVIVDKFIADDDSSIKAKLKWNNENHVLNSDTTTMPAIGDSAGC